MSTQRWKRAEREIATALGGQRMPNTGRGNPDVLTNDGRYAVQIKTRETLPTWLTDAVEQAKRDAGDRLPMVVHNQVTQGKKARRLIVFALRLLQRHDLAAGDLMWLMPAARAYGQSQGRGILTELQRHITSESRTALAGRSGSHTVAEPSPMFRQISGIGS